ncbi:hypothetical protein [Streptacidiphilus sp. EB103A]|uniref:hypothetical protein n=1 Tax=Streptacidiphilus sp. EB103A TaxID=3156275 RepID=UPI003513B593
MDLSLLGAAPRWTGVSGAVGAVSASDRARQSTRERGQDWTARESAERTRAWSRQLMDSLDSAVLMAASRGGWEGMLTAAFRPGLRRMSWSNRMMILLQCPRASWVLGYQDWQKLGRQVAYRQSGLGVLAPWVPGQEAGTATGQCEAPGVPRGYSLAWVFDAGQTIPAPDAGPAETAAYRARIRPSRPSMNTQAAWELLTTHLSARESVSELRSADTTSEIGTRIRSSRLLDAPVEAEAVRGLARRAADIALGDRLEDGHGELPGVRECEVQSVVNLICAEYGIAAPIRSMPAAYGPRTVAVERLKATAQRIDDAAQTVLAAGAIDTQP